MRPAHRQRQWCVDSTVEHRRRRTVLLYCGHVSATTPAWSSCNYCWCCARYINLRSLQNALRNITTKFANFWPKPDQPKSQIAHNKYTGPSRSVVFWHLGKRALAPWMWQLPSPRVARAITWSVTNTFWKCCQADMGPAWRRTDISRQTALHKQQMNIEIRPIEMDYK